MSLRAQRGNRELCMSDLHSCDCFVPRNDIVYQEFTTCCTNMSLRGTKQSRTIQNGLYMRSRNSM